MKNLFAYVRLGVFTNMCLPLVILAVLSIFATYYMPDRKELFLIITAVCLGVILLYTFSPLPLGNFWKLVKNGYDDIDIRKDFVKASRYDNISIGSEYMFVLGTLRLFVLPLDKVSRAYGMDKNMTTFVDHGSYTEEKHNTDSFIVLETERKRYKFRIKGEKRTWLLNALAMNAPDIEIGYNG